MNTLIDLLNQSEDVIIALALLLLALRAMPSGFTRAIVKRLALVLISVLLYVALRKEIPLQDVLELLGKLL